MGISAVPARFKADFGLFWPFRLLANTTSYGQYGPILAESAQFGANQSQVGANPRLKKKKKKKNSDVAAMRGQPCQTRVRHPPNRVRAF